VPVLKKPVVIVRLFGMETGGPESKKVKCTRVESYFRVCGMLVSL
jgi:hypothetical protein